MRYGDYAQPGTPYWLPLSGDTHGSPARYMQEVGPIPADAVTTEPGATAEELFISLRVIRDAKLAETDKMLLSDYPISADALSAVKAYRQTLRDLPDQDGAPWDGGGELTPWPDMPEV
ncbi:MAG: hypothetical protein EOM37_15920 [Proteobacteria bacterium]|nr:hypothetical protein [Pseudomonadota bacterium]